MNKVIESVDVSIKWPFKWTLVGSSGSGKTNFALNIIKNSASLFEQKPDRVRKNKNHVEVLTIVKQTLLKFKLDEKEIYIESAKMVELLYL